MNVQVRATVWSKEFFKEYLLVSDVSLMLMQAHDSMLQYENEEFARMQMAKIRFLLDCAKKFKWKEEKK